MQQLIFYFGSAAKYAALTSGLTCISAFIIFFLLSLFARKTSPIRKRSLYHTCSIYLVLVGIYQIFLYYNMAEQTDPELALFYHRLTYFFGLPTIPIFLHVVLNLTLGGYKEVLVSNQISPSIKYIIRLLWKGAWILTAGVWLINLVDIITGWNILLAPRIDPLPESFIPLMAVKNKQFAFLGGNPVWRIWQITFTFTVALALAFLIRAIWFDREQRSVKWIKTFAALSFVHILFTAIQGIIGYEWPNSFPIPVYSATFLMFAFAFVLIGEIVEARENVIVAYTSSYGSRMVGVVAHELGTPLFIIRGYLQKIQEDFRKRLHKKSFNFTPNELDRYFGYLEKTENALNRLTKTVDDLKAKAGIFQTKLKPVDINQLVCELAQTDAYHHKGKQFEFELETEDAIHNVLIDPEQMRLILRNLIDNAIDALPEENGIIKLITSKKEEHVLISVFDNGKGIPKKFLEKISEPFFTTKFKGTGLGLAIAKSFLNEIKGTLKFDSVEGEGTKVEIVIPYHI